jgi:hypothetical protein
MTSRTGNVYTCRAAQHGCVRSNHKLTTLREVVADYRRFHAPVAQAETSFYRRLPHTEAVARAARAERPDGKRHDHQRRIPRQAIHAVAKALDGVDFRGLRKFSKLYQDLAARMRRIKGIGPLFVYDATTRIGANLRLEPASVYVHAGVKKGVRALIRGHLPSNVAPSEFPAPLSDCTAAELEDLLCIFGPTLLKMRGRLPRR